MAIVPLHLSQRFGRFRPAHWDRPERAAASRRPIRGSRGSDPRLLRLTMDRLLDAQWGATPSIKDRPRPKVRRTKLKRTTAQFNQADRPALYPVRRRHPLRAGPMGGLPTRSTEKNEPPTTIGGGFQMESGARAFAAPLLHAGAAGEARVGRSLAFAPFKMRPTYNRRLAPSSRTRAMNGSIDQTAKCGVAVEALESQSWPIIPLASKVRLLCRR